MAASAAAIQESSSLGSLYELVARGQKDVFFVRDASDSYHPYTGRYDPVAPYISERRTTVPLNAPTFGYTFEIPLEPYGDVLTDCGLLIELPTWLPPLPFMGSVAPARRANSYYWIKDASGTSYGYVNAVGYYLFERIQFYQDQILLQEWSGDSLLATSLTEGSWNSAFLDLALAGQVGALGDETDARAVALRATPGRLRIKLPVPGCQVPGDGGFPLCCVPNQNYRFRIKLRRLEDLVVGVDASGVAVERPAPWDTAATGGGFVIPGVDGLVAPVSAAAMGQPTVLLETRQAYVPVEVKDELRAGPISIAFRRQFENVFTVGPLDYAPFDQAGGMAVPPPSPAITRRLDGRHPTERLVFYFRSQHSLDRNQLDNFVNGAAMAAPSGQFYQAMKLIIAGRDREYEHSATVWQDLNAYAKDARDSGLAIGEMRWGLGDQITGVRPWARQPDGTVNFTTADRPTLYFTLQDVLTSSKAKTTELRAVTEGWAAYEISEGRGRLLFAN